MRGGRIGHGPRRGVVLLIGVVAALLAALAVPTLASARPGPLVITQGGTYSGSYESTDPATPAILVTTSEPVVIDGASVKGPGTLIQIAVGLPADVTVRNSVGEGTSGASGRARFVVADTGWRSLVVTNNELRRTAGIWAHQATPTTVRITDNRVQDVVGVGFVQFVQFDKVEGPIEVGWNEVINRPGTSKVEDVISLYKSGGRAGTPARIHDNLIWGAYPDPIDAGHSGGGIMIGDQGSASGHVEVAGNHVLGTTNYGISIVCGSDQAVVGNTIISSGRTSDGTDVPATNVGLSMGSEARWGSGCSTYADNVAIGNDLGWQRAGSRNDAWTPDCSVCEGNVSRPGTITYADEEAEHARWTQRAAGRTTGPAGGSSGPAPSTSVPTATVPPVSDGPAPTAPPASPGTTAPAIGSPVAAPTPVPAPATEPSVSAPVVPTTPAPVSPTPSTSSGDPRIDELERQLSVIEAYAAYLQNRIEELQRSPG